MNQDQLRDQERAVVDALVASGIAGDDGSIVDSQAHEVASVVAPLLADRASQVESLTAMLERMETDHVDFFGPDGQRIHPDWCRECRVQTLKDAIADIDRHATPVGLLDNDDPEGSPHHYAVTVGALHRALGKAYTAELCESERERLRIEADRLRREVEFEANAEPYDHEGDTLTCLDPCCPETFVGLDRFGEREEHVAGEHPELLDPSYEDRHRDCATAGGVCISHVDRGSLPQCSVHPDRGGNDD